MKNHQTYRNLHNLYIIKNLSNLPSIEAPIYSWEESPKILDFNEKLLEQVEMAALDEEEPNKY